MPATLPQPRACFSWQVCARDHAPACLLLGGGEDEPPVPMRPAPLPLGPAGSPLVRGSGDERRECLVDHYMRRHDEARAEAGVLERHPARRLSGRVFAGGDDYLWDVESVCVGGGRSGRWARREMFLTIDERERICLDIIIAQRPTDGLAEREYDVPTRLRSTAPVGKILFRHLEELVNVHRPTDPAES